MGLLGTIGGALASGAADVAGAVGAKGEAANLTNAASQMRSNNSVYSGGLNPIDIAQSLINGKTDFSAVPSPGGQNGATTVSPINTTSTPSKTYVPASTIHTGGGGSGTDYSPQIGSIDAQTGTLRSLLSTLDGQTTQGTNQIQDQYNQQASAANLQRSRALEDFQNQEQSTGLGKQQALDQVNDKARTLANSVRQMIGNAGGSGSSAYQITAPGAVERQANLQNQDINTTYGQNFDALNTAKNRADQDFTNLFTNLGATKNQALQKLNSDVLTNRNQINGELADLAAQRAAYSGGSPTAAMAPYQADITNTTNKINGLANDYASPFSSITPVTVAAPTLRDYVAGQTSVAQNPTTGNQTSNGAAYNPLASWLKQDDSQNGLFA